VRNAECGVRSAYCLLRSALYSYNVTAGSAKLLKSFAPLGLNPNGPSLNQSGDRVLVVTSNQIFHSYRPLLRS
jgi:hypothetical protein